MFQLPRLERTFIQESLNKISKWPKTDTQLDLFFRVKVSFF